MADIFFQQRGGRHPGAFKAAVVALVVVRPAAGIVTEINGELSLGRCSGSRRGGFGGIFGRGRSLIAAGGQRQRGDQQQRDTRHALGQGLHGLPSVVQDMWTPH